MCLPCCLQELSLLLNSSSASACRAAAAATLCNIGWYAVPRACILAAGAVPTLVAILSDEQQDCRVEAAYALAALTSSHDGDVCAALAAAGGVEKLAQLLEPAADSSSCEDSGGSSSSSGSSTGGGSRVAQRQKGGAGARGRGVSVDCSNCQENQVCDCNNNAGGGDSSRGLGSGAVVEQEVPAAAGAAAALGSTTSNSSASEASAATASEAMPAPAAAAAAVAALGNLAACSAAMRAIIATNGDTLQHIVGFLSSRDTECRAAAIHALLHLTHVTAWQLSDGLVVARVKAAGVLMALRPLVEASNDAVSSCDRWDALRLLGQLGVATHPKVACEQAGTAAESTRAVG